MSDSLGGAADLRTVEAWLEGQLAQVRAELAREPGAGPSPAAADWTISWSAGALAAEAHTPQCWVPGGNAVVGLTTEQALGVVADRGAPLRRCPACRAVLGRGQGQEPRSTPP